MNKKHLRLINCFAATVGIHCAALLVYAQYPHLFQPLQRERVNAQPMALSWEAEKKNRAIDEAFGQILAISPPEKTFDTPHLPIQSEVAPLFEKSQIGAVDFLVHSQEDLLSAGDISIAETPLANGMDPQPTPSLNIPGLQKSASIRVAEELFGWGTLFEKEDLSPLSSAHAAPTPESSSLSFSQIPSAALATDPNLSLPSTVLHTTRPALPLNSLMAFTPPTIAEAVAEKGSLPQYAAYSLTDDLQKVEWRNEFDVDVKLMPHEKNFLFSISIVPTMDLSLTRLKQNFFFLIDRSNSIEKHRYQVFKRAVLKALSFLREGDTFNIIILDREISRCSQENLLFNPASLQKAESFLEREQHGGQFSATDIYSVLEKLTPSGTKDNELYTAILLTDGGTLLSANKQRKTIARWMQKNKGKLALFTAAVGKENNLSLLELLSTCNRGKLLYSETHAAFPRKLAKLVHDLRNPIATDLRISAIPVNEKANIVLYPPNSYAPNFYTDQPYVLIGTVKDPSDFTLLIEGKHNNQWISIEKKISFQNVQKGGAQLKREWARAQAHQQYETFLESGNIAHLEGAKTLLNVQ